MGSLLTPAALCIAGIGPLGQTRDPVTDCEADRGRADCLEKQVHLRRLLLHRRGVGELGPIPGVVVRAQILPPTLAVRDQLDVRADQARDLVAVGDLSQVAHGRALSGTAGFSFRFGGIPEPLQQRLDGDSGGGFVFSAHDVTLPFGNVKSIPFGDLSFGNRQCRA